MLSILPYTDDIHYYDDPRDRDYDPYDEEYYCDWCGTPISMMGADRSIQGYWFCANPDCKIQHLEYSKKGNMENG